MPKMPKNINWTKIGLFFAFLPIIAIAAYVSFGHIRDEVLRHGQDGIVALLTPFSVDGLIMVGYLKNRVVMGYLSVWRRIWCPIAVYGGLAVSLAANMDSSRSSDPVDISVAGWPAVALFVSIKALGVKMPSIAKMVQAITEATIPSIPVPIVPIPEIVPVKATPAKRATPAKKAVPAVKEELPKKAATPRKRTPAKKATSTDNMFKAPVIDPIAVELS